MCIRDRGEIESREKQLRLLNQQLEQQEQVIGKMQLRESANTNKIQCQRDEIQSNGVRLQQNERQLQGKIESQQRHLQQLKQQLKEQEQVTAEIQQTNHSLQRQVEQLQQQLSQQTQQNTKPSQPPTPVPLQAQDRGRQLQQDHSMELKQLQPSLQQVHLQKPHPPTGQAILGEWRDEERAPIAMKRGGAVVDGNVAYFMGHLGETCSYNSTTKEWNMLPKCPCEHSSLAVIRGILTAIGGSKEAYVNPENKLLSIAMVNNKDKKWVEHFPPMPTKRSRTTAVTTSQHLIVAGGDSGLSNDLNTVEVMDIQTRVWSTAASLPHPYSSASLTISGDHLYMLGGWDKGNETKSVLTCSLTKLLQSCTETLSQDPVWCRITDVPVYHSTCAVVNGELVAVGGVDEGYYKSTAAVHMYNPTTNSWDLISNMPTARRDCLVAVLPTNEIMVVGGSPPTLGTNKVEIAIIY